MSIEQLIAKRAEVGPIVDIVDIKFIEPAVPQSEEELLLIHNHTAKQNLKFVWE